MGMAITPPRLFTVDQLNRRIQTNQAVSPTAARAAGTMFPNIAMQPNLADLKAINDQRTAEARAAAQAVLDRESLGGAMGGRGEPIDTSFSGSISTTQRPPAPIYDWDTGAGLLTPDNPLVQPVVYNNEFSPERTMGMGMDAYNQIYAPYVQSRQEQTTQGYRDAASEAIAMASAAGMPTGARGAVQLANQAQRESDAANTMLMQEARIQAFQDTINARELELRNKVEEYSNAWQEVSTYGYIVSDKTGQLLGIQPGRQLTTMEYKSTMSAITSAVASIEAEKVRLGQAQEGIELSWQQLEEQRRQFDITTKSADEADNYNRLIDMLKRTDVITPEIAEMGRKVGFSMTPGELSATYLTEAEIQAAQFPQGTRTTMLTQEQTMKQVLPLIQAAGGVTDNALFAGWLTEQIMAGNNMANISSTIRNTKGDDLLAMGITEKQKTQAQNVAMQVMSKQGETSPLESTTAKQAEKQLTGDGLFTTDILQMISDVTSGSPRGMVLGNWLQQPQPTSLTKPLQNRSNIAVQFANGTTKIYTLPTNLQDLPVVADKIGSTAISSKNRQTVLAYLSQYFYENGKLKSNISLQYY